MKTRLLRTAALNELRASIAGNLDQYRSTGFDYLEADPAFYFEHAVEVDLDGLATLMPPHRGNFYEVENCKTVYIAFKALSPYDARDERLWAYLSHTALLNHARLRWPIPSDNAEAVAHIAKHWFARDKRQVERDQVGSRLWWIGHLCARVDGVDPDLALRAFLFRSDVRANIIERPTLSQSIELFSAIVRRLVASFVSHKKLFERNAFRRMMKEINSVGGYRLLDCLPPAEIDHILDVIISDRLKMGEL